jgi:hypothetical protein
MRLFGTLTEAPARLSRVLSWRLLPLCCLRRNSRDTPPPKKDNGSGRSVASSPGQANAPGDDGGLWSLAETSTHALAGAMESRVDETGLVRVDDGVDAVA